MKTKFPQALSILLVLTLALFSSCEEDSKLLSFKFKASIDGQEFKSATPLATMYQDKIIIEATSLSGQSILLTINGTQAGTYAISASPALVQFAGVYKQSINSSSDDAYLASDGNIIITDIDTQNNRITGTFEFTVRRNLTESITVSNGQLIGIKYLNSGS